MCNWIGSLFLSAMLWGFQDSICDIIIATKPDKDKNKNLTNGELKKAKAKEEELAGSSLNANQTVFLCMVAAFIIVYFYSLWIIFSFKNYLILMEESSLLFQKDYDLKFYLLVLSGSFCFLHYFYLLKAYENSSSTIILPLLQFSSILVLILSSCQKYFRNQEILESYTHLLSYVLILFGGIYPATKGKVTILADLNFWKQPFIKNVLLSEMSHGFYNLCISYQNNVEGQEFESEFHLFQNLEFFIITRFLFILSCIVYVLYSSSFKDDIARLKKSTSPMLCLTLGNEALALLGYFVSAYAYQCYYQTGIVNAAESSLNQLINLSFAFIMKKYLDLGKQESIENMRCKMVSFIFITIGLILAS